MFAIRRSHNTLHIHENQKRIDRDWLSFLLRLICKVFPFKSFSFARFLSLFPYWGFEKTTLMSLIWKIMDQTMPTKFHVSWSKLLGTPVARYQQEFYRKCTPCEQIYFFDDKLETYSEQLAILINVDYQLFVPFQCSDDDRNKRKTQKNSTKDLTAV